MTRRKFRMHNIKRLVCPLVVGVIVACLSQAFTATAMAIAPAKEVKITCFDVGFGGKYRVGNWTPVRINFESDGASLLPLSVIVPDGDGVPSRVTKGIDTDGVSQNVTLYVRFGRVHSDVTVTVGGPGADERSTSVYNEAFYQPSDEGDYLPAVSAENSLVVMVGQKSDVIDEAIRATNKETADHTTPATVLDPSELPSDWIGYDGVGTLILALSNPDVAKMVFSPDDPRTQAIDRWVRQGGRLVFLGGDVDSKLVEELASAKFDSKASLLPGRPVETILQDKRATISLESYIGTHAAIPLPPGQRQHSVPALVLSDPQGVTEVRAGELPLIVKKVYGFGTVTFLAVDPTGAPFDQWRDRGQMMAKLLGMPEKSIDMSVSSGGAVRHLGFTDLSGQMRSALDRFDGVTLAPFGLIIAIVLVYVFLIGPADYFLLKKIGRMSWTWVTFTLIVVLCGVGTFWLAYRMKGDQLHLHRVDLIDVDVTAGGEVRGTSWANLFSPKGTRYDLTFASNLPDYIEPHSDSTLFSWLGLPGRGLGGMNPRAAEASVWRKPYDFIFNGKNYMQGCDQIDGVPVLNWSTKSFTSRWSGDWKDDFAFTLREEDELPIGRVTNPLKDHALEDCLLIYDRWAYKLDTLEPGESVRIDGIHGRMKLNTLLTGRRMVADADDEKKMREQVTPYDTESVDPAYVLRMMMFYEVAGGQRYARLSNRYQPFVDLSDLLGPGRAMLVGRLPAKASAATSFTVDGKPVEADQHMTVFRFVVPVEVKN